MENQIIYNENTPKEVIQWLEVSRAKNQKIRIFYGDTETGKDWMEEYDTLGYIGYSMGNNPIPLLIKNSKFIGGGSILIDSIVRIDTKDEKGKIVSVYKHPNYHIESELNVYYSEKNKDEYNWSVGTPEKAHARFITKEQAKRWIQFIQGKRWAK